MSWHARPIRCSYNATVIRENVITTLARQARSDHERRRRVPLECRPRRRRGVKMSRTGNVYHWYVHHASGDTANGSWLNVEAYNRRAREGNGMFRRSPTRRHLRYDRPPHQRWRAVLSAACRYACATATAVLLRRRVEVCRCCATISRCGRRFNVKMPVKSPPRLAARLASKICVTLIDGATAMSRQRR